MQRQDILLLLEILEKLSNYGQVGRIADEDKLKRFEGAYRRLCRDVNVDCDLYVDPITSKAR